MHMKITLPRHPRGLHIYIQHKRIVLSLSTFSFIQVPCPILCSVRTSIVCLVRSKSFIVPVRYESDIIRYSGGINMLQHVLV